MATKYPWDHRNHMARTRRNRERDKSHFYYQLLSSRKYLDLIFKDRTEGRSHRGLLKLIVCGHEHQQKSSCSPLPTRQRIYPPMSKVVLSLVYEPVCQSVVLYLWLSYLCQDKMQVCPWRSYDYALRWLVIDSKPTVQDFMRKPPCIVCHFFCHM